MGEPSEDAGPDDAAEQKYCRKCGHPDLMRIPRRWQDRLWEVVRSQKVKRYRCGRCRSEHSLPG